jgi:DNA-binding MarR family transcriptional regulator
MAMPWPTRPTFEKCCIGVSRRGTIFNCLIAAARQVAAQGPHAYLCLTYAIYLHIHVSMSAKRDTPATTPCLCSALRQASRAVSRLYDEELREVGLRTTQYSLLRCLSRLGEVRQGDLGELTSHEETTLTRNLRPLVNAGWVAIDPGEDRREKFVRLTKGGATKLKKAQPAWERAQERLRSRLPKETWSILLAGLPDLARLADGA